jgi:hypothetical protein
LFSVSLENKLNKTAEKTLTVKEGRWEDLLVDDVSST